MGRRVNAPPSKEKRERLATLRLRRLEAAVAETSQAARDAHFACGAALGAAAGVPDGAAAGMPLGAAGASGMALGAPGTSGVVGAPPQATARTEMEMARRATNNLVMEASKIYRIRTAK